jgi:serine/threonine-protein kinase HipA
MSLTVYWDGRPIGLLSRTAERTREYAFEYTDTSRALSLSLPTDKVGFTPAESRPFFEALLPEGTVREQIASQRKLAASDTYGLLAELGRDCAGAIQIMESRRMSDPPAVAWLDDAGVDALIADLPSRPLGLRTEDGRVRLSLAGVQHKAPLVRDNDGRFGEALNGMPTTHILKPDLAGSQYSAIATNEFFCMSLAARCGLVTAQVELGRFAGRPCLIVERYDRDLSAEPVRRRHQEDLCQALGLTPDFKYQHPEWRLPSFEALANLLNGHGARPGVDRLGTADAAVFNYLVGNADAHAKNISLLHDPNGVRLAPLYDIVSTGAYPDLNSDLALGIGDEFDPDRIGTTQWDGLASDLGLRAASFARRRAALADSVVGHANALRAEAEYEGWHDPVIDRIVSIIRERADLVR